MSRDINYVKIKRDKIDKCNICGNENTLTWDHVPPKKSIFFRDVEITSIFNTNLIDGYPREYSQNGTKYRTICEKCNNTLGTLYDIGFVEFINEATQKISLSFTHKEEIVCKIKPVKVIKSILGHLLAAKGDYEETLIDKEMREYVLGEDGCLPPFNIYYWFYPHPNIQVVRDLAICKLNGTNNVDIFSMLKMYPISFFITKGNLDKRFNNLANYCTTDGEAYVEIPIDISVSNIVDLDWPIIVDDETIFLAGKSINSSITSTPRELKKSYSKKC